MPVSWELCTSIRKVLLKLSSVLDVHVIYRFLHDYSSELLVFFFPYLFASGTGECRGRRAPWKAWSVGPAALQVTRAARCVSVVSCVTIWGTQ